MVEVIPTSDLTSLSLFELGPSASLSSVLSTRRRKGSVLQLMRIRQLVTGYLLHCWPLMTPDDL
jgi:hypothetical protein